MGLFFPFKSGIFVEAAYLNPLEKLLVAVVFYLPIAVAFVFGTVVGSLSNVMIARMVYYKSIWSPPSHCGSCGTEIPWYLNIPIVSYLVLRGRCRFCGSRFSSRYFWVELTSGFLYALVLVWVYSLPPRQGLGIPFLKILSFRLEALPTLAFPADISSLLLMIKGAIFATLLLVLSVIDLEHRLLPDRLTVSGMVLGLILSIAAPINRGVVWNFGHVWWAGPLDAVLQAVMGLLVGGGVLYLIALVPSGMGGGDVKLVAMIGAFVGVKAIGPSLFIGFITGGIVGAGVIIVGLIRRSLGIKGKGEYVPFRTYIPFGPFLAFGGIIGLMWGHHIWSWYVHMAAGSAVTPLPPG